MASTTSSWPEGFSRFDFRDPKIWQEPDGSYSAVLVGQGKTEGGAALLFHSPDGFHWEYVTILDASRGEYGVMWECPDFFELDGKQVLMVGPMEMQARDEFHNGHCVIALIGSYDPVNHRFVRENVQLMDEGMGPSGSDRPSARGSCTSGTAGSSRPPSGNWTPPTARVSCMRMSAWKARRLWKALAAGWLTSA